MRTKHRQHEEMQTERESNISPKRYASQGDPFILSEPEEIFFKKVPHGLRMALRKFYTKNPEINKVNTILFL